MTIVNRLAQLKIWTTSDPARLRKLYLACVFLFWAALYYYVPTLPIYARTKTEDLAAIGVVLSMYGLWQAFVRLPLGITADLVGKRKPFIIVGFLLAAAGALVMGLAGDAFGLGVGRAITGLSAATWVPLVVLYSSLFPPEEAVSAATTLTLVNSLSRMIASALNGPFNEVGGYPLAFFVGTATALAAVIVLLPAREKMAKPRSWNARAIGKLIIRRDVLLPSLLSAIAQYATWATVFGFLPILAKDVGASDTLQGILTSLNIGIVLAGNILTTFLIRRISPKALVLASFVIMTIGILAAAFAVSMAFVFVAAVFIGLSTGINYPILMGKSIENVAENERATAMGVYQSVYAVGMFSGPWLSGILARAVGIQPMFAVTGFVCLLLGLLGSGWIQTHPIQKR